MSPAEPRIGVRATTGLLSYIAERGVDAAELVARVELPIAVFEDAEASIALRKFVALLELCADATKDDCFGLHFAARYPMRKTGLAGYMAINSPSLGEGCRAIARYYALLADASRLALEVADDSATLSYRLTDATLWPRRQDAECMIAVLFEWVSDALDGRSEGAFSPREIRFEHAEPRDVDELRRHFGAKLVFGTSDNAIVFDAGYLEAPVRAADRELVPLLTPHVEELLARKERADANSHPLVDAAVSVIGATLNEGAPTLEAVAQALGVGPRTMQRRLREANVSFQQLVERARYEMSLRYLEDRALTVTDVALRVGYSDATAFNRAFRRWTGAPPSARRGATRGSSARPRA